MGQKRSQKQPKGRNERMIRILQIICDLDRIRGFTIKELAARYDELPQTIKRDFKVIAATGLHLESDKDGREKRWRIEVKNTLTKLSSLLDVSHYLALKLAMEPGSSIANDSPLFATLEDLAIKIGNSIGPARQAELDGIESAFFEYDKRAYKKTQPDVLWPLVCAIRDRKLCRVTYRAPRDEAKDKIHEVLPLKLFTYDGAVYLMCHSPKLGHQMKLNLQRLRSLKVLKRHGRVPRDFNPKELETAAFGLVADGPLTTYRLRFDKNVAPYIRERTWHSSQKLRDLPDHDVEIEFRCAASYEVANWVQSWGDGVEVLAPASLRRQQQELGQWLIDKYRDQARKAGRRSARVTR